jgi:hypothetical protein
LTARWAIQGNYWHLLSLIELDEVGGNASSPELILTQAPFMSFHLGVGQISNQAWTTVSVIHWRRHPLGAERVP